MDTCKFPYKWTLKDAMFTKDKGKVFSCFACGGGSTMGYKLAGFDVIGCNEIDPRMMDVYIANHHPKYHYCEPIQTFKKREDLPEELYCLDILDGSPPCSSFSTSGNRSKDWGKEKKFKEGQAKQVLDTLFFDFIELAKKLQPKVVIAENVKGLLLGEAIDYVRRIYQEFDDSGYYCQHFLLNSRKMGVPQRRERVFFICIRKDLSSGFLRPYNLFEQRPFIEMNFNETDIPIKEFTDYKGKEISSPVLRKLWDNRKFGDIDQSSANNRLFGKLSNFGQSYVYQDDVCCTLTAKESSIIHFDKPLFLSNSEVCCVSTFPLDYNFKSISPHYIAGMSVPPVMMAQIANNVYEQWLCKMGDVCKHNDFAEANTKSINQSDDCHNGSSSLVKNHDEQGKPVNNQFVVHNAGEKDYGIKKVHCLFEQSGTFKNEFIKLGINAEDYDIQNNFGETDHIIDLFKNIEECYNGEKSIFDSMTKDDLIMAFFPCIYFCQASQSAFTYTYNNYKNLSVKEKTDKILERSKNREYFYSLLIKLFCIVKMRGLRMIVENPYSGQHYLTLPQNFVMPPTFIDHDRQRRGDYYKKPTSYWFVNLEPTHVSTYSTPKEKKTVMTSKGSPTSGVCSEERSLISPDYARNFICDFIIGKAQNGSQLELFNS